MRLLGRIALVFAGLLLLAVAVVYGGSEWILRSSHAAPLTPLAVPHDAASVAEGGRVAQIYGCRGCHGPQGQGRELASDFMIGRIVAPPFASVVGSYQDAELVRLIRQGVTRDGRGVTIMPSHVFTGMADEDVARIVAWLRTVKPSQADVAGRTSYGPMGRLLVLLGAIPVRAVPEAHGVATRPADFGGYYAGTMCAACHDLHKEMPREDGQGVVPPLAPMAASYDLAGFTRLLREGKTASGKPLTLMGEVTTTDTPALTDAEIASLHAYLVAQDGGATKKQ